MRRRLVPKSPRPTRDRERMYSKDPPSGRASTHTLMSSTKRNTRVLASASNHPSPGELPTTRHPLMPCAVTNARSRATSGGTSRPSGRSGPEEIDGCANQRSYNRNDKSGNNIGNLSMGFILAAGKEMKASCAFKDIRSNRQAENLMPYKRNTQSELYTQRARPCPSLFLISCCLLLCLNLVLP